MWHLTIRNPPIPDCQRINGDKALEILTINPKKGYIEAASPKRLVLKPSNVG
jgi:hypothetical protein